MADEVTQEVSTETPAPTVEAPAPTPDIQTLVSKAVEEALAKEREGIARKIQSEADKRVAPLQRRLNEEINRRQGLEGTLRNLPTALGDVDPSVRQSVENLGLRTQVNYYEQQNQAAEQARRAQEMQEEAMRHAREEVEALGLNPDDPRVEYDMTTPSWQAFHTKLLKSVGKAKAEDEDKRIKTLEADLSARIAKQVEEKVRKDTGVDSQPEGQGAGMPTFTREQIKDRAFYEAHKDEIKKAQQQGRIK